MPRAKSVSNSEDVNPDYVRMYYEHQYDRVRKHEEQTLTMSNIVLTISTVIITFGFNNKQSFGSILILFLPMIIIIVNVFVILYINDRSKWIGQHSKRAKKVLEVYAPALSKIDKEIVAPPKKWPIYRKTMQNLMHYLFVLIGIILLTLFILEAFGVSLV